MRSESNKIINKKKDDSIPIEVSFTFQCLEYYLNHDRTDRKEQPFAFFGFDTHFDPMIQDEGEDGDGDGDDDDTGEKNNNNNIPTSITTLLSLPANDANQTFRFKLRGTVPLETLQNNRASILLYISNSQLNSDLNEDYNRMFQAAPLAMIHQCRSNTRFIVYATNKENEIIGKYEIVVLRSPQIDQMIRDDLIIPLDGGKEEKSRTYEYRHQKMDDSQLFHKSLDQQSKYNGKITTFMKKHFRFTYPGTETMTLFNDNYGFDGKNLYYTFIHSPLRPTNPEYWDLLLARALDLHAGVNACQKPLPGDHNVYYASLDDIERVPTVVSMLCLPTNCSNYLTDVVELVHTTVGKKNVEGNLDLHHTTTTTFVNGPKPTLKYVEDFCPIHFTWSSDCEDDAAFICPYTYQSLMQCAPLVNKDTYPALYDVIYEILTHYQSNFNALMGTERRSVENVSSEKSAHMCSLLFRNDYFASLPCLYLPEEKEDASEFSKRHQAFCKRAFPPPTIRSKKFPSVLLCEGTGMVHATYIQTDKLKTRLKDNIRLMECVKETLEFTAQKTIPFYRYVFEILTNDWIDRAGIPVQSFVLTYNEKESQQITNSKEAFRRQEFVYGVEFTDLLNGSPDICLIATPKIPTEQIENARTIAKHQLPYPPFFMDLNTKLPLKWVDDETFKEFPLVCTREILMSIKNEYKKWLFTSFFDDEKNKNTEDENVRLRRMKRMSAKRLTALLVPPKNFKALIEKQLYVVYGGKKEFENNWYGFQVVHIFSNLSVCVVWICTTIW